MTSKSEHSPLPVKGESIETQSVNEGQNSSQGQQEEDREYSLAPFMMTALIDSANDAIISKTLDGIITSWNKGAERIFGYTAKETIGKPILILIPPELYNEEPAIIERIRSGERVEHYETVRRRKDGALIDISLTVSPIHAPDGRIIGASKIARDITELKQAQRQLHASEARYQSLFNSLDDGFCVIEVLFDEQGRAYDYRFLEINPAFERQSGLVNVQGKTMRDFVPDHSRRRPEIYAEVARTGEPIRFDSHDERLGRWFDIYAFRVDEPDTNRVAVLFTDIMERKMAETEKERLLENLNFEQHRLLTIFEQAPAFVAMVRGPKHVFEMANPAYYQLVGHRDILGKPLLEAIPEIEGQGFAELLNGVLYTGVPFEGKEILVRLQREPNGPIEERFVNLLYQPLFEADETISGVFSHGVDITEQVRARRIIEEAKQKAEDARMHAEQANRTKDEFLAILSHELRTPLTAIIGWTSILQSGGASSEEVKHGVNIIERNAHAQAQLIEDILDVSRMVTGKMRLNVQPVDVTGIIEEAVSSVLPTAQTKNIRLQRVLDAGSCLVSGDPARLQQIIWNLLSNAIKFTPKGGRVQILLERVNSHVEIVVSDNGLGIAPETLPLIFDRFRQADSSSTRSHGGLGLGLSIVRHLVEMHGGSVEAYSGGLGQGSVFTVSLPLVAVRSFNVYGIDENGTDERRVHPTTNSEVVQGNASHLQDLHVLVVDDQEDTRMFLRLVLEQSGARVTACASAAEGLVALQELRPDVLLSDIGMPEVDGYSLIKQVRALSPENGGLTPAAALTAFARLEDRVQALRAGFQIHIPKPVNSVELISVIASLAGRHEKD